MSSKIPIVNLEGSPYERGFQHGSKLKKMISSNVNNFFKCFQGMYQDRLSLRKEKLLNLCKKFMPYAKEYAPELTDEVRGIAEGATMDFEEVFCLNCMVDLLDFTDRVARSEEAFSACTAFAISEGSPDGDVLVGQTVDEKPFLEKSSVILKVKSDDVPSSLVYAYAGTLGGVGENSWGISLALNKLLSPEAKFGVPCYFICRKVLEQKTIGDAIGIIANTKRATNHNYLLGDVNGELYTIETTPTDYNVIYGLEGYIVHTNHFISNRFGRFNQYAWPHSIVRFSRAKKFFMKRYPKINIEDLKNLMMDHVNYPLSICRHLSEKANSLSESKTISSIIMQPKKARILVQPGNPCKNAGYTEYKMPR